MTPARLLIVEDERIVALDLRRRLETLGYEIVGAVADGPTAIDRVEKAAPDLVLMDIHIEGPFDGIETARRLMTGVRTPVIFLTAFAEQDTLARAREAEPYGYVVKPYETRELHAAIQMALSRHEADLRIERSERRLRLALDAAEMAVWEWDPQRRRMTTAGRLDGLFGDDGQTAVDLDAFAARFEPDAARTLASLLAAGKPVSGTFALRRDHAQGWIEVHARSFDAGGVHARIVGVARDVTDRVAADGRLRQAAVVYRATGEGIAIVDAGHRLLSVNPAFTRLTGWSESEVLGRDPDALLHDAPQGPGFWPDDRDPPPGGAEAMIHRRDGSRFPALEQLSRVNGAGDEAAGARYVLTLSDLSAVRQAEQRIAHLAHHDSLTGLPNRRLFRERIDAEIDRCRRLAHRFAVLFIDLDGFKSINDTLGHLAGDRLLELLALRLSPLVRRSDTLARLGGDEFVMLMTDLARDEDAERMAEKLLAAIGEPAQVAGETLQVGASIGIAIFDDDAADADGLMMAADTAMYAAKTAGRARACFHTREMAERSAERLGIEQGLRRAIAGDGIEVAYQPLVDLRHGGVSGFEALVRWRDPNAGLRLPHDFIDIAEDTGLIEALGARVLTLGCRQMKAWLDDGFDAGCLSVNVSERQLRQGDFEDQVARTLRLTGLPPRRLELEITESTLHSVDRSRRFIEAMGALGVAVAIDDFGTHYSSLSLLKHLSIDRLKIDRSFVDDLPGDGDSVAIVQAILALARALALEVTAEGIEREDQRALLAELGCCVGQGWLFSAPLAASEVLPWLRTRAARV